MSVARRLQQELLTRVADPACFVLTGEIRTLFTATSGESHILWHIQLDLKTSPNPPDPICFSLCDIKDVKSFAANDSAGSTSSRVNGIRKQVNLP